MTNKIISFEKIKQDHIERLEDRLRSNGNKLVEAMTTMREQEIQLQMLDDTISEMIQQAELMRQQMQEQIDKDQILIYELEQELEKYER